MAKGKKRSTNSGGPHKKHGPKKKMFHCYSKCIRIALAQAGLLKKEYNDEARAQSENAKKAAK